MMTIREMDISARAKSCLMGAGYKYVYEIEDMSDEDLLNIRNLNEKCLEEIKEALKDYSFEDDNIEQSDYGMSNTFVGESEDSSDNSNEDENYKNLIEDKSEEKSEITSSARKAYESVKKISINVLDQDWSPEDIIGLIQYDVFRIAGIMFLFSDITVREEIINQLEKLFGFKNTQRILEKTVDDYNVKSLTSDLFRRLPYSVGLMFEHDQEEQDSNLSYLFYEILKLIIFSVLYPDGSVPVDEKLFIYVGIMESIKNHLICSGIKKEKTFLKSLPDFKSVCQMYDFSVSDFEEVEGIDNGKKLYDVLVINMNKIEKLVERSTTSQIDSTYSRKKYQDIAENMQTIDIRISITKELFSNLSFSINVNGHSIDDEDVNDEDIDGLWNQINTGKEKAIYKYGYDCKLIIHDMRNYPHIDKVIKNDTLIECLKYAQNNMNELGDNGMFMIQYGEKSWNSTGKYRHFSDLLKEVCNLVQSIPEPFDDSILPDVYINYSNDRIDEYTFNKLWNELQKIEEKYKKGINYDNRYKITDWESELCYEQGKFLENVYWVGREINNIPNTVIPFCTYSKMNKDQLKYYLYWRTCFRNGEIIFTSGMTTFYFLCVYELLADFGPFSSEERLNQLEKLYINYTSQGLSNALWVGEYANIHDLEIKDDEVRKWVYPVNNDKEYFRDIIDIIDGKYDNVFDHMCRKSRWKLKSSSFLKKANCLDDIKKTIDKIIPKLEKLFDNEGIKLSDFLAGRIREEEIITYPNYYEGSIWNERILNKLGIGNDKKKDYKKRLMYDYPSERIYMTDEDGNVHRETNTSMNYTDPYLSEYVLKYTEMLFRQKIGYDYLSFPEKLKGALKMKFADGYSYVLSADPELQKMEKTYISLYDKIEKIICDTTNDYFESNYNRIEKLISQFKKEYQPASKITYTYERKTPVDELMAEYICNKKVSEGKFDELLNIYHGASPSYKESKAKKLSKYIFDYWVLSNNNISLTQLSNMIDNNKWYFVERRSIVDRNYDKAIPYFCSFYNALKGVSSKRINPNLIKDCIVISFTLIDRLFSFYGVDSSDVILGKWDTYPWIPFENMEEIYNVEVIDVRKNVGDLELYSIDLGCTEGTVSRHAYSEQANSFILYIMRGIENKLRGISGYKSFLSNDIDLKKLYNYSGYEKACDYIDDVISGVVNYVVGHSCPLEYDFSTPEIVVSCDMNHDYSYPVYNSLFTDIDSFINDGLKDFYREDYSETEKVYPYDIVSVDIDDFDFEQYCRKYNDKAEIQQKFAKINIYRFHDIYDEVIDRFMDVKDGYPVEYDPKYDFTVTNIMNDIKGLIGKDLGALTTLVSDNEAFLQWLSWVEHGKVVIPNNMPLIQIMFHFAMNRIIFENEPEKCLVILCEVWNYYYDSSEKIDESSDLLLEWIKDYWMVYCPDISYDDFKRLFRFEITFENESNVVSAKEHFFIDISHLKQNNLLEFYNANCDYHVLDGAVVRKGYRDIFEEAIEEVHKELSSLWNKYDIDFEEYLHYEDKAPQEKQRELFFRGILTGKTKKYINSSFEGRKVSENEEYSIGYDYDRSWPVLVYNQYEISNSSSRILLDYIIKHTERVIRDHLRINYTFKFDDEKMYELFPIKIFEDNLDNHIIVKTIERTTDRICKENGI